MFFNKGVIKLQNVKLLWLLQQIEQKEKELFSSCRSNPALQELKRMKENLNIRQQEFEKVREKYHTITRSIKQKEDTINSLMEKQKEMLKKMYDGSVNNSKDLTKMQQQSQQISQQAKIMENQQLEEMEEKERLTFFLKSEQKAITEEVNDFKSRKMQYDLDKLNSEQELAQLADEKERIIAQITEDQIKKFRNSQKNFNGSPVTLVGANRLCSFCRVEIIRSVVENARKNPGKVSCECCGRILYVE